jgi:hypothetical protein
MWTRDADFWGITEGLEAGGYRGTWVLYYLWSLDRNLFISRNGILLGELSSPFREECIESHEP